MHQETCYSFFFFFRYHFIWIAERERDVETGRASPSIHWFTPQIPIIARTGPGQNQEPKIQFAYPMLVAGTQALEPPSAGLSEGLRGTKGARTATRHTSANTGSPSDDIKAPAFKTCKDYHLCTSLCYSLDLYNQLQRNHKFPGMEISSVWCRIALSSGTSGIDGNVPCLHCSKW